MNRVCNNILQGGDVLDFGYHIFPEIMGCVVMLDCFVWYEDFYLWLVFLTFNGWMGSVPLNVQPLQMGEHCPMAGTEIE
jgi:hypothetical protein